MDSISQIALGAAVGQAVLGKKIGNHAIWVGALCGTLPDLDVLLASEDPIRQVIMHRGISHSFFGIATATPAIAAIFYYWRKWRQNIKVKKGKALKYEDTSYLDWILFVFLTLVTHPLLDSFTTYGTQLFLPFSNERVAFNTVFVADPLYTFPFLACIIIAMCYKRSNNKRTWWNNLGLIVSTGYIALTTVNKLRIDHIVEKSAIEQNIPYERYTASPSPLNQILWNSTFETKDGFYVGSYSHLDKDKQVEFTFLSKNDSLREVVKSAPDYETLKWFSNDYYVLTAQKNWIDYADLRFGPMEVYDVNRTSYGFKYNFVETENGLDVIQRQKRPELKHGFKKSLQILWGRITGIEQSDYKKQVCCDD